jgi:hypothetical protein
LVIVSVVGALGVVPKLTVARELVYPSPPGSRASMPYAQLVAPGVAQATVMFVPEVVASSVVPDHTR